MSIPIFETASPSHQPKIYADGEVDWNRNATSWRRVFEKFGSEAQQFQSKVARLPRNFNDVVACLKAGYTIPYGTNLKLVLDRRTGFYNLSGRTMHCMSWSGYGSGDGRRQQRRLHLQQELWLDGRGVATSC